MKIVDLTHRLCDGLQTHASHPRVVINDFVTHAFSAPRYLPPCGGFATKQLLMSDHAGTHVDAPSHFYPEGKSIDRQGLDLYMGSALLLDVSHKEPGRQVDLPLVREVLARDGLDVAPGDIVLIRAWAGSWGEPEFHSCAGLGLDAAQWLGERGIKAVGIDLGNIEDNADMTRCVHLYLLGRSIAIYENLANLNRIGALRFTFVGLPLALEGCTGSPVRAVALLDDSLPS
ncbi:MAG: cyclase family protein [Pseudomonadota bacterium]